MFLITLMRNDTAAILHDGWWALKFLIVAVLFVTSMWIPNSPVLIGYMKFARVFSVFFLSYQAMMMLIVAYMINHKFVSNASNNGTFSSVVLVVLFAIFTLGNIVWIIFQFILFSGCGGNVAIMVLTTIAIAAMYGLVLLRTREDASMFTSSLVASYCLYLQWSAMSSNQSAKCNPYSWTGTSSTHNAKANTITLMIFGLLFTFAALITISASTKKANEESMESAIAVVEDEADSGEAVESYRDIETGEQKSAKEMHVFPITPATIYFQLLLTCCAIYYAMLLTNWGSPVYLNDNSYSFFGPNNTSYWCQLTAMWVSMAIYFFSLLGPLCFPDRTW